MSDLQEHKITNTIENTSIAGVAAEEIYKKYRSDSFTINILDISEYSNKEVISLSFKDTPENRSIVKKIEDELDILKVVQTSKAKKANEIAKEIEGKIRATKPNYRSDIEAVTYNPVFEQLHFNHELASRFADKFIMGNNKKQRAEPLMMKDMAGLLGKILQAHKNGEAGKFIDENVSEITRLSIYGDKGAVNNKKYDFRSKYVEPLATEKLLTYIAAAFADTPKLSEILQNYSDKGNSLISIGRLSLPSDILVISRLDAGKYADIYNNAKLGYIEAIGDCRRDLVKNGGSFLENMGR